MAREVAKAKKMHVRKGDSVVVITGKDAGKKGKILDVVPKTGRVYVDKINLVSRHTRPTQGAPQGGIVKKEAAIDSSNVMLYCDRCGRGVRVSKDIQKDGSKIRVCCICGYNFDK